MTLLPLEPGGDRCAEGLSGCQPHHPPAGGGDRHLPEAEAEGPAGSGLGPALQVFWPHVGVSAYTRVCVNPYISV